MSTNLALLLGRLLIAAIFVPSGFGKLTHIDAFAHVLATRGVPAPHTLAIVGACVEFFGSLCVLFGLLTRYAALLMAAFTLVAALIAHRFWAASGAAEAAQYTQFMKNMAIVGGFLFLCVAGPGRYSVHSR
ncbi:MAG TPA: DoxX family protein [Stellaceae bacterium]|jgi:putative oxidoreductase|nr:DoxX family protein [Stellaceae bacterium]